MPQPNQEKSVSKCCEECRNLGFSHPFFNCPCHTPSDTKEEVTHGEECECVNCYLFYKTWTCGKCGLVLENTVEKCPKCSSSSQDIQEKGEKIYAPQSCEEAVKDAEILFPQPHIQEECSHEGQKLRQYIGDKEYCVKCTPTSPHPMVEEWIIELKKICPYNHADVGCGENCRFTSKIIPYIRETLRSEKALSYEEGIENEKKRFSSEYLFLNFIDPYVNKKVKEARSAVLREVEEEIEKIIKRHTEWKPTEGYKSDEENGFQKGLIAEAKLFGRDITNLIQHIRDGK